MRTSEVIPSRRTNSGARIRTALLFSFCILTSVYQQFLLHSFLASSHYDQEDEALAPGGLLRIVKRNTSNITIATTSSPPPQKTYQHHDLRLLDDLYKKENNTNHHLNHPPARNKHPCRIIIENGVDFHHEIIESVVNRYPLPWNTFNCTTELPIVYDFLFLTQNEWKVHDHESNQGENTMSRESMMKSKPWNETEVKGWKSYFEKNLQYRTFARSIDDGTVAYYRHLFQGGIAGSSHDLRIQNGSSHDYQNLFQTTYDTTADEHVDAIIDISCDLDPNFRKVMQQQHNRFCVVHRKLKLEQALKQRTCWISPMYPSDHCFFLPLDLPKVNRSNSHSTKKDIHICAVGGRRNYTRIVEMFATTPFQEHNIKLTICSRTNLQAAQTLSTQLLGTMDSAYINFTYIQDFVEFANFAASCDIYLPATDPKKRKGFFPWGAKRLTGAIPQIIAYNLSSVMHSDLETVYHKYLSGIAVEVYTNETGSDVKALNRMIQRIVHEKTRVHGQID